MKIISRILIVTIFIFATFYCIIFFLMGLEEMLGESLIRVEGVNNLFMLLYIFIMAVSGLNLCKNLKKENIYYIDLIISFSLFVATLAPWGLRFIENDLFDLFILLLAGPVMLPTTVFQVVFGVSATIFGGLELYGLMLALWIVALSVLFRRWSLEREVVGGR